MGEVQRVESMIKELRSLRNDCEPKSNENPRYHRYSSAASALLWLVDDRRAKAEG